MPRNAPNYVANANLVKFPIDFRWGKTIAARIFGHEVDSHLYEAIRKSSFKASYAAGIAASEWVVFRFAGHSDVSDELHRIEAAWASEIQVSICRGLKYKITEDADDPKKTINGPLQIAMALLYSMHSRYSTNNMNLPTAACRQILLAQHVLPKAANFEAWISRTLRDLARVFPRREMRGEAYDWHDDEIVPREFFEVDFTYTRESSKAALQAFLATLNPALNPYLRTPDEMKASGFGGTPYIL